LGKLHPSWSFEYRRTTINVLGYLHKSTGCAILAQVDFADGWHRFVVHSVSQVLTECRKTGTNAVLPKEAGFKAVARLSAVVWQK